MCVLKKIIFKKKVLDFFVSVDVVFNIKEKREKKERREEEGRGFLLLFDLNFCHEFSELKKNEDREI